MEVASGCNTTIVRAMLRRIGSGITRAAGCSSRADIYLVQSRDANRKTTEAARTFSSTSLRSARGVLKANERQLMTEIGKLRREAAVHDVGIDGISKSESTLPPVTEEMLETVYRALNVPDEPTEEELRLEQRRLRAIGSPESRQERTRQLADRARARLGKALRRLEQMDSFLKDFDPSEDTDHVANILTMLRSREGEDREVDLEGTKEVVGKIADPAQVDAQSVEFLEPSEVLSHFRHSLQTLQNVSKGRDDVPIVPQTLFSLQDWKAVVRLSASTGNLPAISQSLELMTMCGFTSMRTQVVNVAMDFFATHGDVSTVQWLLSSMLAEQIELDEYSRHCLVKCYTKATRYEEAISVIQSFESSTPAPLATYTLLIASLIRNRSAPLLQAKIWPIFQQMRMKAHPIPDAPMYAHMITACALGIPQPHDNMFKPSTRIHKAVTQVSSPANLVKKSRTSDAERGLDLFREMTMRYQVRPTPEVYAAVIFACAGRREYYQTSLRIFQSMLDQERERVEAQQHDAPSFAPDRMTFNALLRGCAKNGDLKRARWILAEMLRGTVALIDSLRSARSEELNAEDVNLINARRPDTETIVLLLYTYATYVMPESLTKTGTRASKAKDHEDDLAFSDVLPTSTASLLREVDGLMERILSDQQRSDGLLSTVKPNTKLMSAYFSVLSHWATDTKSEPQAYQTAKSVLFGSFDKKEKAVLPFDGSSLYERWSLPIDAQTCKAVLEICEKSKASSQVIRLADTIWSRWRHTTSAGDGFDLVAAASNQDTPSSLASGASRVTPQDVSDCWAGMIRCLAKADRIDEAVGLLREFIQLYPPRNHYGDQSKRLTGDVAHLSYYISNVGGFERPALTLRQLDVLYQRLRLPRLQRSEAANKRDLLFVIWAAKAYDKDVKPRLPEVLLKAKPYVERYQRPGNRR